MSRIGNSQSPYGQQKPERVQAEADRHGGASRAPSRPATGSPCKLARTCPIHHLVDPPARDFPGRPGRDPAAAAATAAAALQPPPRPGETAPAAASGRSEPADIAAPLSAVYVPPIRAGRACSGLRPDQRATGPGRARSERPPARPAALSHQPAVDALSCQSPPWPRRRCAASSAASMPPRRMIFSPTRCSSVFGHLLAAATPLTWPTKDSSR